jgi:hypothetical protein
MKHEQVWVLLSVYNQDDNRKPENWATSVYATAELAEARKKEIENRSDINRVVLMKCDVQVAEDYKN